MKLDIRYPMMFRSTITGDRSARKEKFVDVHHIVEADIPEISSSETDIALGTIWEGVSKSRPYGALLSPLRSYDGRYFRRLALRPEAFGRCHIGGLNRSSGWIDIGSTPHEGFHPGGYDIRSRNAWISQVMGILTQRNDRIWPYVDWHETQRTGITREAITLESIQSRLQDIDAESYDLAKSMMDAQTERLLVIDGDVWIETTMPCVTARPGGLNIEFLPLGVDTRLDHKRFPLSKFEDASDYALANHRPRGKDATVDIPVIDMGEQDFTPFDFDEEDEELYRVCFAVASAVTRRSEQQDFHPIYEGKGPLFEGQDKERFDTIRPELFASNDILGERGSLHHMLPEIADLWQKCDYPLYNPLLPVKTKAVEALIDRCLDSAPISMGNVMIPMAPVHRAP